MIEARDHRNMGATYLIDAFTGATPHVHGCHGSLCDFALPFMGATDHFVTLHCPSWVPLITTSQSGRDRLGSFHCEDAGGFAVC